LIFIASFQDNTQPHTHMRRWGGSAAVQGLQLLAWVAVEKSSLFHTWHQKDEDEDEEGVVVVEVVVLGVGTA
jgi:hypothetical protein